MISGYHQSGVYFGPTWISKEFIRTKKEVRKIWDDSERLRKIQENSEESRRIEKKSGKICDKEKNSKQL